MSARTFRITNVREDLTRGSGSFSSTQMLASLVISDGTQIANPVLIGGFFQSGLNPTVVTAEPRGFSACEGSTTPVRAGWLRFTERFANAFKTRYGESGRTIPVFGRVAGQADFGTRLKAVFEHVPLGVRLFVTTSANTDSSDPAAVLIPDELFSGTPPVPTTALAELPVVNGSATAVWEVLQADATQIETFTFGVWQQFDNTPSPGTATVRMMFAPTATADDAIASATLPVGRFSGNAFSQNVFRITPCRQPITPRPVRR